MLTYSILAMVLVVAVGILVERFAPAIPCTLRGVAFNLICLVPFTVLRLIGMMAVTGGTVAVTNWLGGGFVDLPGDMYLVPAVVAYTIVMDFGEYVFHRAQHRIPALWAMHSFHHSDATLNISTTFRHFWAEQAIKACTIYLMVGLLFKVSPEIIAIYSAISFLNYFFHMNIRVGFGRGWFLLNSPQFHRVHHSSLSQHFDKNFAALFPMFDAIFGTVYRPHADEYPPSGLDDQDQPRSLIEAMIWPARTFLRPAVIPVWDRPAAADVILGGRLGHRYLPRRAAR
jgi:sterol desaturase/sphingolipid hydroxylase (fatty acid hydroxylase superfamily)